MSQSLREIKFVNGVPQAVLPAWSNADTTPDERVSGKIRPTNSHVLAEFPVVINPLSNQWREVRDKNPQPSKKAEVDPQGEKERDLKLEARKKLVQDTINFLKSLPDPCSTSVQSPQRPVRNARRSNRRSPIKPPLAWPDIRNVKRFKGSGKVGCYLCNEVLDSYFALSIHVGTHFRNHAKVKCPRDCYIGDSIHSSDSFPIQVFAIHLKYVHRNEVTYCSCKAAFFNQESLRGHVISEGQTEWAMVQQSLAKMQPKAT